MSNYCADQNDGKLSDCCGARIRLDRCMDCKEFCSPQEEDEQAGEENLATKVINHQINQIKDFTKLIFPTL